MIIMYIIKCKSNVKKSKIYHIFNFSYVVGKEITKNTFMYLLIFSKTNKKGTTNYYMKDKPEISLWYLPSIKNEVEGFRLEAWYFSVHLFV